MEMGEGEDEDGDGERARHGILGDAGVLIMPWGMHASHGRPEGGARALRPGAWGAGDPLSPSAVRRDQWNWGNLVDPPSRDDKR